MSDADIRFLSGNPSDEEVAAVTAVLTAALAQLASESRRDERAGQTAWQRSQRALRAPLVRGAWQSFGR